VSASHPRPRSLRPSEPPGRAAGRTGITSPARPLHLEGTPLSTEASMEQVKGEGTYLPRPAAGDPRADPRPALRKPSRGPRPSGPGRAASCGDGGRPGPLRPIELLARGDVDAVPVRRRGLAAVEPAALRQHAARRIASLGG